MSASPSTAPAPADKKNEKPVGRWETILTMTPVVLTVLATVFAGMSSSEMTQSMYYRSMAAQNQSKAGDQWGYFQTKKIRGTNIETGDELLQGLAHPEPFEPVEFDTVSGQMLAVLAGGDKSKSGAGIVSGAGSGATGSNLVATAAADIRKTRDEVDKLLSKKESQDNLSVLLSNSLPKVQSQPLPDTQAQKAIDAVIEEISERKTEAETAPEVRRLKATDVEDATKLAEHNADAFAKVCDPIGKTTGKLQSALNELVAAIKPLRRASAAGTGGAATDAMVSRLTALVGGLRSSFKSAMMEFDARRYKEEATYNLKTAELLEVQVRRSGVESDRHRDRSRNFFYCMLVAQAGVTIASLALSREKRNVLWLIAALAGFCAVSLSGYIYFSL